MTKSMLLELPEETNFLDPCQSSFWSTFVTKTTSVYITYAGNWTGKCIPGVLLNYGVLLDCLAKLGFEDIVL